MKATRTVGDLVLGQAVETIGPEESISEAQKRMEAKVIHSLLVYENGKLESGQFLGIVTMTDTASSMFRQNDGTVASIMTPAEKVLFVSLTTSLFLCGQLMWRNKKHHMVVKGAEGQVVGVISTSDLARASEEAGEEAAEEAKNLQPS